ncbi:MAG TPA: ATP-binding protein [Thermoanaerobaculia bacterium]
MTPTEGPRPPEGDGADEEAAKPSGARLALRFFLVPLLVVLTAVGIFLLVNVLTFERRSAREYLSEVRGGSASRRWQAAFELSRSVGSMKPGPERRAFAEETLRVLDEIRRHPDEDPRVRRYLVLVLGRLGENVAAPALRAAAGDPDAEIAIITSFIPGVRFRSAAGAAARAQLEVQIVDNGPGLDPAIAERLFEAFATTKPGGMGLGLTVAADIVARHEGRIEVDSVPGRTAFKVLLPIDPETPT